MSMIWHFYDDIETIKKSYENAELISKNTKVSYYNTSNSFDIETSSFIDTNGDKVGLMYLWAVCINGYYFTGRTWFEFLTLIYNIGCIYELNDKKRLVIYVHNLSYECQFIKNYFDFEKVIANQLRKPISLLTTLGIEFRCSYLLSGYSLSNLAKIKLKGRVKKMNGALDYSLLRNSKTRLTRKEYQYMFNDVRIVYEYIKNEIENNDTIFKIPLTKTGYVRRYVKENTIGVQSKRHFKQKNSIYEYRKLIKKLTIPDYDTYKQINRAFQGGFTHASCLNVGKIFNDVSSYDFTSSYPTMLIAKKYPMSAPRNVKVENANQFNKYLNIYCCLFDVTFYNLKSKNCYEHYISAYHCGDIVNGVYDNGRLVSADKITTTITEIDFDIIKKMYDFKKIDIANFKIFNKAYLPKPFIECILKLYNDKTQLKGVLGKEIEYLNAKEMLNSMYGMCVTDIMHEDYTILNGEWGTTETEDFEKAIENYNKSFSRFLYYPWGVWCTAYARQALFTGITEFNSTGGYVYSDTDSIKCYNANLHKKYFKDYNKNIINELEKTCEFHHLDKKQISPKNIKGQKKPLGVWDYEGKGKFKTLRSKCYMSEKDGKITLTVSGLNKNISGKYLKQKYGTKIFENFNTHLVIPKGKTGKMIHWYVDDNRNGTITDYQGNTASYNEQSGIYLEDSEYRLELTDEFLNYVNGVQFDYE